MTNLTIAANALVVLATITLVVMRYIRDRPANIPPIPFSDEARATIERAAHESGLRGFHPITQEHLVLALLLDQRSHSAQILERAGVDVAALRARLLAGLPAPSQAPEPAIPLYTNAAKRVLERSAHEAFAAHQPEIQSVHLLAAVLHDRRSSVARVLRADGVTLQGVRDAGRALLSP